MLTLAQPALVLAQQNANPLTPDPGELVVGALAFFVMLFVLAKMSYPNIRRTYAERTERIEGGLARAEQAQTEAQQALEGYQRQLAESRAEATGIREQARADAQRIVEEIRNRAEADAAERLRRAEEQIEAARAQAVRALRAEVGRLSVELTERLLGQALERDEAQQRLVEDFLAGLEGGALAASGREA